MMKILNYIAVLISAAVFFSSAAYGEPLTATGEIPHIISSVQFPQTRWRIVRHNFQLQIPQDSRAISSLSIGIPSGLTVKKEYLIKLVAKLTQIFLLMVVKL